MLVLGRRFLSLFKFVVVILIITRQSKDDVSFALRSVALEMFRVWWRHTTFTTYATFRRESYNLYLSVYDGSCRSQYTKVFYRP